MVCRWSVGARVLTSDNGTRRFLPDGNGVDFVGHVILIQSLFRHTHGLPIFAGVRVAAGVDHGSGDDLGDHHGNDHSSGAARSTASLVNYSYAGFVKRQEFEYPEKPHGMRLFV